MNKKTQGILGAVIGAIIGISIAVSNESKFDPSDSRSELGWTKKEYKTVVAVIRSSRIKISDKYGSYAGDAFVSSVALNLKGMTANEAVSYVYRARKETMANLANYYGH